MVDPELDVLECFFLVKLCVEGTARTDQYNVIARIYPRPLISIRTATSIAKTNSVFLGHLEVAQHHRVARLK
jgi:hypothetical protein